MLKLLLIPGFFMALHIAYVAIAIMYTAVNKKNNADSEKKNKKYKIEHIVCFKNESHFVEQKLANSYSLNISHELHHTFVNDNSHDNTLELLHKFKDDTTKIISNSINYGKNQSQIKAVNQSQSDLLLFTDANVFLTSEAVEHLVAGFDDFTGGVTGNVRITTDYKKQDTSGKYWEIEKIIKEFQTRFHTVIGFDGGFYCIKRENYYLKRENELSDFESAFLIFENKKGTKYIQQALVTEVERRTLRNSFRSRIRASNRTFWSFFRIFKYARHLDWIVLMHFFLHKIVRYLAAISLIIALPFILLCLFNISAFLLLIVLLPWVGRLILECAALCLGGVIALTGKEYTTWSQKKS